MSGGESPSAKVRFGIVSDVHKDVMHDADDRLTRFIDHMQETKPDFILQLGDFCTPIPQNLEFLAIWNSFSGPRYHVIGNHDMDGDREKGPDKKYDFTREQTMAFWGMPAPYYAFDQGGAHFVILDGNDPSPDQEPYYQFLGDEQLAWLERDLEATTLPTFLFCHQGLERSGGVANQEEARRLLEEANRKAGGHKVIACFSGHHHRDYLRPILGILHAKINSMSYYFLGSRFAHVRYNENVDRKYPTIKHTAPYRDPLYAVVTIDLRRGILEIAGTCSRFVGPSPWELGASREELDAPSLLPKISDRRVPFAC
ncbi:MAG: alkaline phosphatase [Gemmatimonadetes bacterium]|nr:alkaline phosphatase [Gemmatimonadota bacterium]